MKTFLVISIPDEYGYSPSFTKIKSESSDDAILSVMECNIGLICQSTIEEYYRYYSAIEIVPDAERREISDERYNKEIEKYEKLEAEKQRKKDEEEFQRLSSKLGKR